MARFEVYIPAAGEGTFNVTLKVTAENWMSALRSGMQKLGEQGNAVANIMVDIMEDNSIHVTSTDSGRVFRIKELDEAAAPSPDTVTTSPGMPAFVRPVEPPPPAPPPAAAPIPLQTVAPELPPVPAVATPVRVFPKKEAVTQPGMKVEPQVPPMAAPVPADRVDRDATTKRVPAPTSRESAIDRDAQTRKIVLRPEDLERAAKEEAKPPPPPKRTTQPVEKVEQVDRPSQPVTGPIGRVKRDTHIEDALAELFERTQDIYQHKTAASALSFLLDLAMEKIHTDAGSVFVADLGSADLALESARGPAADKLMKMKLVVPVGVGIVGFCAQEAVSVAISDTEKDPRFFRDVSDKLGYAARSILCCPMVASGRTFGAIEVINKKGSSTFTPAELSMLAYIAHQGARYLERIG